MGVLKTAKPPLELRELDNRRQNYFKKSLQDAGVGNSAETTLDWRKLMIAIVANEGKYTITSKGFLIKNEAMLLIEKMAKDDDWKERVMAAMWLGEMRLNFPEFGDRRSFPTLSGWMDEMLIVLGTDKDAEVRRYAYTALNKTVSLTELAIKKLGEMEEKEKKKTG